jgi:hypothetical protein
MRCVGWMVLALAACGGGAEVARGTTKTAPAPAMSTPATSPPATTIAPPAAPPVVAPVAEPACDQATGLVAIQPAPIAARWDHHLVYAGEGPVEVHWCGPGAVEIQELGIGGTHGLFTRRYEVGAQIARRGAPVTLVARGLPGAGSQPASILALDDAGATQRLDFTLASVDDPARVQAIAACTACRGTWGSVGMSATETCDCPTADAGKRCVADAECESVCIATGWEPMASPPASTCARDQRAEQLVGRCHGRQHAFGCRPRVTAAQTRCVGPGPRRGDRLPTVCAD